MKNRAVTKEQKRRVLESLLDMWQGRPTERLGQFLLNTIGAAPDDCKTHVEKEAWIANRLYSIEDFDLVDAVAKRLET